MGNSPRHASSVPLVLNPNTGRMTTQFHAVFDEWFHTVAADPTQLPNLYGRDWSDTFGASEHLVDLDDEDTHPPEGAHPDYTTPRSISSRTDAVTRAMALYSPSTPLGPPLPLQISLLHSCPK